MKEQLELLSLAQAARILRISNETLNTLIAHGKIRYLEVGSRKKIPLGELQRYQTEYLIQLSAPPVDRLKYIIPSILSPSSKKGEDKNYHHYLSERLKEHNGDNPS
ncbi:hypothetical protein BAC3_00693 [uncultured bacterium]|nr:hypothetical protein BAC3_00693 [uncultured bacterium]